MNKDEQFFYDNAGYSYNPMKETPEQGRERCAAHLASAEQMAHEQDCTYQWYIDDLDSRQFSSKRPYYKLWYCLMRDADRKVIGSLSGVDFGRDKEPWGDPYRRVVEAELASEHFYKLIP